MTFPIKSILTCGAALACLAAAAKAQTVDYAALQQTFGEPVTMSATGKPQRASDVPADMIIITQDQIRRSGAVKLMDLLQFVPGLDVRMYGNADAEVNVHGYTQAATPRLLVLVNGRQVYLDHLGYVDWNTIPVQLSEIQQIEIVKGPGSALFGFNAASGVINIITINPQKTNTVVAQATAGTYGVQDYSGVISHQITNELAFKLSGGYSSQKAYHVASYASVMAPWDPTADNAAVEVDWQITDKIVARAEGTYARSRQLELSALAGFANMAQLTNSYKFGILADSELGLIDLTYYRNHLKHVVYGPPGPAYGPTGLIRFFDDVSVLSASDLFKVGTDVTVRLGGEYRFGKVKRFTTPEAADMYAVDGMVDWAITPSLSWTNSGRLDFVSPANTPTYTYKTMSAYSFNSGLVYKAGPEDTLRLLAGRSMQLPAMLMILRNPGIAPSSLMKYQATWDHVLPEIASTVHASVYYQKLARVIIYGVTNLGDTASTGFELSLNGADSSGWRWNASYNYRSVADDLHYTPNGILGYGVNFEQTMPANIVTFGLGKTIGAFEADVEGKWVSKSKDLAPVWVATTFVDVPDYLTMTARIGWRISDNFTLAFTAEQLNQETVFEGTDVPDKRRFMVTLTSSL